MKPTLLYLTTFAILLQLLACHASLRCDPHYVNVDQWCYRLYPPANFYDASVICKNDGAYLVSIHDSVTNRYVANFGVETLIGLRYTKNYDYEWSDGTSLNFTSYDKDFYANREYYGDCAKNVKGVWQNAQCFTDSIQFLCRKKAVPATTSNYQCPDASAVYKDFGELTSPGYPGSYDGSSLLQCRYQLIVKNDRNVEIDFSEVDLGTYDTIFVYEGWSADFSNLRGILPNADNETRFVTDSSNFMLIVFNGIFHGLWRASWYSTLNPHETTTTTTTRRPVTALTSTTTQTTTTTRTTERSTTTTSTTTMKPSTTTSSTSPTTTTSRPKLQCVKDIFLLLDTSIDASPKLFEMVRQFITGSLIEQWNVDPLGTEVGLFSYSKYTSQLTDFDLYTVEELKNVITSTVGQTSVSKPDIARALKTLANFDRERRDEVKAVTILFAGLSDESDVNEAKLFAYNLTSNGNSIITVAYGEANSEILGQLSSSSEFSFGLVFEDALTLTDRINSMICMEPPTHKSTAPTIVPPSPTAVHQNLPCAVDIAVLIDGSTAPNASEYWQQIRFVQYFLASQWYINSYNTEAMIIVYENSSTLALGAFDFTDNAAFIDTLSKLPYQYSSGPNITQGLLTLLSRVQYRRPDVRTAAILFTFSSNYEDVQSAVQLSTELRLVYDVNLFVVVPANSMATIAYLRALSGSVFTGDLTLYQSAQTLNSHLCTDSLPPAALPPLPTTTTSLKTTVVTPTAVTQHPTEPSFCADCMPSSSSILVLVDGSNGLPEIAFELERQFIREVMVQSWNHFERTAIGVYDDTKRFNKLNEYGDLNKLMDWEAMMDTVYQFGHFPSLTNALKQAKKQYFKDDLYGPQKVVIFVSSRDEADVSSALEAADLLKSSGAITVVATGEQDATVLQPIASDARHLIRWADYSDTTGLAAQIFNSLD